MRFHCDSCSSGFRWFVGAVVSVNDQSGLGVRVGAASNPVDARARCDDFEGRGLSGGEGEDEKKVERSRSGRGMAATVR